MWRSTCLCNSHAFAPGLSGSVPLFGAVDRIEGENNGVPESKITMKYTKNFIVLIMVGEGGAHREVFGKCPSLAHRNRDVM